MESRRVVFDCWVLGRDEQVVLFALVTLVWYVELGFTACWVFHLLLDDVTEYELLAAALISTHKVGYVVNRLKRVVEARACLCNGIVSFTFLAKKRGLRGCKDLEVDLEPANTLCVSEELKQLDFVDGSILQHVSTEPCPIFTDIRLLKRLFLAIFQRHSLTRAAY